MSFPLWKYFFDDDVDSFRQYLARATFDRNASKGTSGANTSTLKVGSPGNLATSPRIQPKSRKNGGLTPSSAGRGNTIVLTRSDVNARDGLGRTLLHHAVSSHSPQALEFVRTLIEIPLIDLYVQDTESGWTALHRALYFGNIAAAQALMVKDIQNATDYTTNVSHTNAGGLVKIKDHEGNSPFEVFSLTTAPRLLQQSNVATLDAAETASLQSADMDDAARGEDKLRRYVNARVDLHGDEIFAFGSNKNITLGLADGDDRQFPERIQLTRPEHLLHHLYAEFRDQRSREYFNEESTNTLSDLQDALDLPAVIRNKPVIVQDVVMSKLHTAVLTQDPISNLHICGYGPGGRLGTGDEATRFSFVCIQGGGLAKRRVVSIALGQDHSIAVCSSGEVFTWGSNKHGQLGYELPEVPAQDTPLQLTPRQIYGLIKKEQIIGAAASSLHSAVYTSSGLYTFGKNEGQLGLMDADARSLEMQVIPRRIGVSILQHPIHSVSAIDRATTVLLENHEVIVFTHYAFTKVVFPLDGFGSNYVSNDFFNKHNRQTKHICKVTSGGNTICAMTSYGEVFTIDVPARIEAVPSNKSTTNPTKARNALPVPSKVWSIRKSHMAALDAAVGQDGSVLLCTASGTVWKKEKRANIKVVHGIAAGTAAKPKDYKFVRVPNIFGAMAVRSNAFGAFYAIRKDCDVMKDQIIVEPPNLWKNMFDLLAFRDYNKPGNDEEACEPELRFWKPATKGPCPALIKRALLSNSCADEDFMHISRRHEPLSTSDYDVWITSDVTDVRLPVHSLMLKARSKTLRAALAAFSETYYFSLPDVLSLEYGSDGQIRLHFSGADFLTITNLVLYLYTDQIADVWRYTSKALHLAPRYRQVRMELMRIATALDLKQLERAVRVMDEPADSLRNDFETAFHDSDLFSDADVVVDLADGEERYAHSVILRSRCPFFEGLFYGHTGGMWMADRRQNSEEGQEAVRVDLKHVDANVFELVLRHIYADTSEELFDAVVTKDLDGFVDLVIEVMAVANELMLDRLARVCQKVIGRYVTPRSVCGLLNTIAESSEVDFKQAALEYIGLNLENMLEQGLLEELDEYLLEELDETVQSNQLAFLPFAKSERALEVLLERDFDLAARLESCRQRRLDSMRLPSRYVIEAIRPFAKSKVSSNDVTKAGARQGTLKEAPNSQRLVSPSNSPVIAAKDAHEDLPFEMDDDHVGRASPYRTSGAPPPLAPSGGRTLSAPLNRLSSSHQSNHNVEHEESDHEFSSLATTPRAANASSSASGPSERSTTARAAWSNLVVKTPKLDLKDIMQQDSSVSVSNLTQSLKQAASSSSNASAKLSQKERKRQQLEMKLQTQAQITAQAKEKENLEKGEQVSATKSPWQKVAPKPAPPTSPFVETSAAESFPVNSGRPSLSSSGNTRQTTANASQGKSEKSPQPARSTSSPGMTGFSGNPAPQIQSVRHTPIPARSTSWLDARTSMADILAQQQIEKIAIKEVAAKRSLQEIQQEQEFQEWWDNESRRVQEEEAAVSNIGRRKGKGERGRGGNKRKASGRGENATVDSANTVKVTPANESGPPEQGSGESSTARKGGQQKSRGGGRGRGRGF
ncbi:hypothetical protein H2198_005209 [Neophaeococcomyces mojaviensis]|uniref:Uncharacterized protein n=1 Tax=Neophaeococcomyces mojaviensis TaxID=3383035 RepID=A0ACC3A675_9EURO|nr:hypothetical protein H2198_005209 [Knufia sp. JES_112]